MLACLGLVPVSENLGVVQAHRNMHALMADDMRQQVFAAQIDHAHGGVPVFHHIGLRVDWLDLTAAKAKSIHDADAVFQKAWIDYLQAVWALSGEPLICDTKPAEAFADELLELQDQQGCCTSK